MRVKEFSKFFSYFTAYKEAYIYSKASNYLKPFMDIIMSELYQCKGLPENVSEAEYISQLNNMFDCKDLELKRLTPNPFISDLLKMGSCSVLGL